MIIALIALISVAFFYFQERWKRRVAFGVHVTERTEEAETLDFAVNLYEDEPFHKWAEKLERAYSIAEARRANMNARMQAEYNRIQKEAEEAKHPKTVVPLNKKA